MPAIKLVNQTTNANVLNGLKFQDLLRPALISLYASAVTATDRVSYSVDSEDFLDSAAPNIEASADVVDTDRDQILFQEPVPAGKQFLPITATTAVNVLLVMESV
jgi:hypothetical protein